MNTLIEENDHPWFGIPYPGTYVINPEGTITHKFFDNNLAVRAGPEQLLRAARGEDVPAASVGETTPDSVEVSVELEGGRLVSTVQRDLVVRFRLPAGRHAYADPAPQGSVAADVILDDNDRLVQRPLIRPASELHTLAGTDESFQVYHGQFELRLPLTVNGGLLDRGLTDIVVAGEVRWQTCDDEVCDIPAKQRFELQVPVAAPPPVALRSSAGAALEPNAKAHFQRMSERRKS